MRLLRLDHHAGERAIAIKTTCWLVPAVVVILSAAEAMAWAKGWIGSWTLLALLLLNIPFALLLAWAITAVAGGAATGLIETVFAMKGGIDRVAGFSHQESLVARGRTREAAAAYRAHLRDHPEHVAAHLKLAQLHRDELGEPDEAERVLLAARGLTTTGDEAFLIANQLIDLYRRTGRRGRLKVELARFRDRYAGTRAAEDAARLLQELKAEDLEPDQD